MHPIQFKRQLKISLPPNQSAFLWGARQTGKTTLLNERFANSIRFDLLDSDVMLRLLSRPRVLGDELAEFSDTAHANPIVIHEIQKVPELLDEVHRLIETERFNFVLCGSNRRKLMRAGVNLLGGRAWGYKLYPLSWSEIPEFDLLTAMSTGLLPGLYAQPNAQHSLNTYVRDYLTREVFNEGLVRNNAGFSRFFDALPYSHGQMLNYSAIAQDCAIDAKTARTYFHILVDTLIGYLIYPFRKKGKRQAISSSPKFYLFDIGIANYICEYSISSKNGAAFGRSFEHFIFLELVAANSYLDLETRVEYWRTKSGLEVDFILGKGKVAIDVKSRLRTGGLRAIKAFKEEFQPQRSIVVTAEPTNRLIDGIEVLNYEKFLEQLHGNKLL